MLFRSGNGISIRTEGPSTNALFLGISANKAGFFQRGTQGGSIGLTSSKYPAGDGSRQSIAPNLGRAGGPTMRVHSGFAHPVARSVVWENAASNAPSGATDVRIYRVMSPDTLTGLQLIGTP